MLFGGLVALAIGLNLVWSFNLRGEPMVARPLDALATFHRSGLDVLYVDGFRVVQKP